MTDGITEATDLYLLFHASDLNGLACNQYLD